MENRKGYRVAVVGAGVAGLAAALALSKQGVTVDLYEKSEHQGGHLRHWQALFPGREEAAPILKQWMEDLAGADLTLYPGTEVKDIRQENSHFILQTGNAVVSSYHAVVLACGFELFDAARKEEYGYGIYPGVVTSAELEPLLHDPRLGLERGGKPPGRVAFVHCVGSRDAKTGNHYCSRVCCITGVKQAIAVRERYPECEVLNFYMDLRMFGSGYEELYQEAQEKYGIQFIRGRVSEAASTLGGAIQLKAEDTLMGRPVKVTADWLVLLIGMEPAVSTGTFSRALQLRQDPAGFFEQRSKFRIPGATHTNGLFVAGACAGPASIPDSVNQGKAAALSVVDYLSEKFGNHE